MTRRYTPSRRQVALARRAIDWPGGHTMDRLPVEFDALKPVDLLALAHLAASERDEDAVLTAIGRLLAPAPGALA